MFACECTPPRDSYVPIVALLLHAADARAQDWPQFRGPTGQGDTTERGLPAEWSETRNIAWKTAVPGRGWSSPVVAHGRVWLTTATTDGRDASLRLVAYAIDSGQEALNVEVFRLRNATLLNEKNSHASPTPVVDGERVYVHFGAEGTAAVTIAGEIGLEDAPAPRDAARRRRLACRPRRPADCQL